jgi:NAD(P)-dependent dehydrogenase (short-subunit alcohol dehydrogenase family)
MARTILVCGYGPGISSSVAQKFGQEGYQVAAVARSADKLEAGVAKLSEAGIEAKAFPCDLGQPEAIAKLVADVREQLGPIHTLHWNAYGGAARDLTTCSADDLRADFDVSVTGTVVAVQQALPDLEAQAGAVLITGGGFAYFSDQVDKMAGEWGVMGLAMMKSTQHKLTRLLHFKLAPKGVFVGSVVVMGIVKGTAFDREGNGIDPDEIAGAFWKLASERQAVTVDFPGRPPG